MEVCDDDHDEVLQQFFAKQFKGSSVNSGQRICNSLRSCDFLPHTGTALDELDATLQSSIEQSSRRKPGSRKLWKNWISASAGTTNVVFRILDCIELYLEIGTFSPNGPMTLHLLHHQGRRRSRVVTQKCSEPAQPESPVRLPSRRGRRGAVLPGCRRFG
jgi:hypothetical protein